MEKLLEAAGEKDSTEGSKEVSLRNEKFERKKVNRKKKIKFFCKPSEKGSHTRKRKSEDRENLHQDNHEKRAKINVKEKVLKKLKSVQQENHKINEDTISEKRN